MNEQEIDALMQGQEDENGSVHYEGTSPHAAGRHTWAFLRHAIHGHFQLCTIYGHYVWHTLNSIPCCTPYMVITCGTP